MNTASKTLLVLLASALVTSTAVEAEEILKVKKSTFVNLVDLLVQRGVINQQEGSGLLTAAEQEAATAVQDADTALKKDYPEQANSSESAKGAAKSKHVGYVPEFVKKEIRDQVRAELKSEVVNDVKQDAKTEGWGIPGALPEWVAAINPSFDLRLRFADEFFGNTNQTGAGIGPYNYLQINQAGGLDKAMAANVSPTLAFVNNTKDRLRLRERFRLGFEANIADGVKAGVRFATSNNYNPVSNDQTLGNTGQPYQFAIDRSYLQYDYIDEHKTNWFSVYAGRIINPFLSTDVVFDPDLSFEGIAGSFRFHFNEGSALLSGYKAPNPTARFGINQGQQTPDSVFLTLGVFPIQNVNFSSNSKWLYAGQLGFDWLVFKDSRFNMAASYYEYQNVSGRYNTAGGNGHENDWTAPQFVQQGNSMVAITDQNSGQGLVCADGVYNKCLFGLASGFKIFNATATYDYLYAGQTHILLTADYAKNLGFNQQKILAEFHQNITPRTTAYQVRIDVGYPQVARFGDWNVNLAYRYLERDAVLDAFTDSIFHLGGTDARGWVIGTQYAVAKNTWLNLRWFSTDSIDGIHNAAFPNAAPNKSKIDTLNLDLNARF